MGNTNPMGESLYHLGKIDVKNVPKHPVAQGKKLSVVIWKSSYVEARHHLSEAKQ